MTTFTYSGFGELATEESRHGATVLYAGVYARDDGGRLAERTETIGGTTTTDVYGYDLAGRLTAVTRGGAPLAAYTYDANGNRTSVTTGAGTIAATYDAQDRILTFGDRTYTHTAHGEVQSWTDTSGTTTLAYDVQGNLLAVNLPTATTVEYVVDGRNRRIGRKVNGAITHRWLYQGQLRPIAELDAGGAIVSRFVYGDRAVAPEYMTRGGTTYRFVADHLGSIRLVINTTTGVVAQRLDYDAWGRITTDTNPGFQPFGFAGGIYDDLTGLVRFGFRDYEPLTGRWLAKDPIGFDAGDLNLFAYVGNDPVNWIDPSGLGKVGLFCRTVKGLAKRVSREGAQGALKKGKDVEVAGPAASKKARQIARDQFGDKTVRHDPHAPGQKPHYQHKNGNRGHVKYTLPGAAIGVMLLGDNVFGQALDFFNPLSDLQDLLNLFEGEDSTVRGDIELPSSPGCECRQ